MKISGLVISVLLIGLIIVSVYNFMDELAEPEHFNVGGINSSDYRNTYNKLDDMNEDLNATQQRLLDVNPQEDAGFFTGGWDAFGIVRGITFGATITRGAISATKSSVGIGFTLIQEFATSIGLPAMVSGFLMTLLSLGVIGALVFLIIKRQW